MAQALVSASSRAGGLIEKLLCATVELPERFNKRCFVQCDNVTAELSVSETTMAVKYCNEGSLRVKNLAHHVKYNIAAAVFIFCVGGSSAALAAGDAGFRKVRDIHIEGTVYAVVYPSGSAFANPDGCGSSNLAIIQTSDGQYNQKLALALTALAQGTQVDFWLNGCLNTPWGYSAPIVYAVDVSGP